MSDDLLRGELVRLAALNPETDAETVAAWSWHSDFGHFLQIDAPRPWSVAGTRAEMNEELTDEQALARNFGFNIRALDDDRLLGFVHVEVNDWTQREGWLGIGIGRPEDWGKGYGTDAMRVLMRYAFCELNLERLTLNVFAYNQRAVRSYEKAGFVVEGRQRQYLRRGDQRYDMIFMAVLRDEWQAGNGSAIAAIARQVGSG
jgi:RimJ/RimL family protein N-acetyltransferase